MECDAGSPCWKFWALAYVHSQMKAESLKYLCSKMQNVALIHSLRLYVEDDLGAADKQLSWKTQPSQPRYVSIFGLHMDVVNISCKNVIEVEPWGRVATFNCMDIIRFCPVLKSCIVQRFFPDHFSTLRQISFKPELFRIQKNRHDVRSLFEIAMPSWQAESGLESVSETAETVPSNVTWHISYYFFEFSLRVMSTLVTSARVGMYKVPKFTFISYTNMYK